MIKYRYTARIGLLLFLNMTFMLNSMDAPRMAWWYAYNRVLPVSIVNESYAFILCAIRNIVHKRQPLAWQWQGVDLSAGTIARQLHAALSKNKTIVPSQFYGGGHFGSSS